MLKLHRPVGSPARTVRWLLLALVATTGAFAAEPLPETQLERLQLTGGIASIKTTLTSATSIVPTEGGVPTFGLRGAFFPLRWLGIAADLDIDTFVLHPPANQTTLMDSARLFNVDASLAAAFRWAPVIWFSLEGHVGLGVASRAGIVIQPGEASPVVTQTTLFGPSLGVLAGFRVERFLGEAQFLLTPSIAGSLAGGDAPKSGGFLSLSLTAGVAFIRRPDLNVYALLQASASPATATRTDTVTTSYGSQEARLALGVRIEIPTAPEKTRRPGAIADDVTIIGTVRLADGAPAVGAALTVAGQTVPLAADGTFSTTVPPGIEIELAASLAGFHGDTKRITPTAELAPVTLKLTPADGPGSVKVFVFAPGGTVGIADAEVFVADVSAGKTNAQGELTVPRAGPGPVKVSVKSSAYTPAEEIVSVPPEAETTVRFTLGERAVATLKGLIRSASGKPIQAAVKIKGLKVDVVVKPDGRFSVQVPGGTWTLTISAPGHATQVKNVDVADGDQALFHTNLQPLGR